ncbi:MAG TPA: TetR/AcrR family transcriptional regulator [Ktedonobacterales bacterium]|nr:TetR/AcrR family transcriptional regulator [Ktedonobacterales bacterium]
MPRPDVSEERRSQILDAATAVFAERGFHEARMDDIAERSGLSKGALYLYYKSKDAIIAALMHQFFKLGMRDLRKLREQEGTVSERLIAYSRHLAVEMRRMTAVVSLAWEFYAIAARQKVVRDYLKVYFAEYRTALAELVQDGMDRGELRLGNATEVATTLTGLYEGLALLAVVDASAADWTEQVEASVRLLLAGLRAE